MKKVKLLATTLIIIATFCAVACSCTNRAESSFSAEGQKDISDIAAELDEFMTSFNKNSGYKYSGAVLAAKGDEILLCKGYGMADYESSIPNKPSNVFAIGSLTKSFTAAAIMQLYEKQYLDVNDSISKYIDGHPRGDDITIHHLLTHTSGLVRDGAVSGSKAISLKENIDHINSSPLLFEPGDGYSYSNAGYNILAAIIEKVSGISYGDYLKDNIFVPIGMNSSSCGVDDSYIGNQAVGYRIFDEVPMKLPMYDFSKLTGSGNIYSTVLDLYKYDRALYNDKLLNKESIRRMFSSYSDSNYGYGWGIGERYGHREISHNGHIDGYYSAIFRYPEDDYVLIFLTNNSDYSALHDVSEAMAAIIFGKEYYTTPEVINVVEVDKETLEKYCAQYRFDEGLSITITYTGGILYSRHNDGSTYELLPVSDKVFHYKGHESTRLEFVSDKDANVVGIKLMGVASVYEGIKSVK